MKRLTKVGFALVSFLIVAPGMSFALSPAPTMQLDTLQLNTLAGINWQAKSHRGQFVVLNFWATWCKPCVKEMPDFQSLSLRRDVAVLGLAYEDSSEAELKAFLAKLKITYPVAKVDVYEPLPAPLEVPKGLPTTLVFDRQGLLIKKFLGPVTRMDIEKVIAPPAATPIMKK